MGIIGNNLVRNLGIHRGLGDVYARTPGNYASYSSFSNTRSHAGDTAVFAGNAIPAGSYFPDTFYMPQEAGEISMRMTALGALAANLYPSRNMSIDLTGTGELTATAALVISMLLDLVGSGDFTAYIVGDLNMSIDLSGSGDLEASMEGIAEMIIALTGQGTLEATIAAYGNMAIDIVVTGAGLTVANVSQAIWNAIAANFNEPGTMGQKLNSAAVGGIDYEDLADAVWTAVDRELTAGTKDAEIDNILDIVQIIEKLTGNKVTKSGDIITIYETDGITPWRQYNLASGGRVQV